MNVQQTFVISLLNKIWAHFDGRLISRKYDPEWALHSADLNASDLYLWSYLENNLYQNNPRLFFKVENHSQNQGNANVPAKLTFYIYCIQVCLLSANDKQKLLDTHGWNLVDELGIDWSLSVSYMIGWQKRLWILLMIVWMPFWEGYPVVSISICCLKFSKDFLFKI